MNFQIVKNRNSKVPIKKMGSYHHGDLKSSIILAVGKLIEKNRSTNFQLKDVADMVNTSVAAIYKHYENKQQLLVEVAIEGYSLQKAFRDFGMEVNSLTPMHKLIAIGFAYVAFAKEYPGLFLLMKSLETPEMLENERYLGQRDETISLVNDIFKECVAEGLFIDHNTEIVLTFLQATSLGFALMSISDSMNNYAPLHGRDKDLVSQIYPLALKGLITEKGSNNLASAIIDPFANLNTNQ